jgi:hypothetical protein
MWRGAGLRRWGLTRLARRFLQELPQTHADADTVLEKE